MKRYVECNPNPHGKRVGDCAIRAISLATGQSWDDTFVDLCCKGFRMGDMPSANHVWGLYLRDKGFVKHGIEDDETPMTIISFCESHSEGIYVVAVAGHVVCCSDGQYFDVWDSGNCIPLYYWKKER